MANIGFNACSPAFAFAGKHIVYFSYGKINSQWFQSVLILISSVPGLKHLVKTSALLPPLIYAICFCVI